MSIYREAYRDEPEAYTYVGLTLCDREHNWYDDSDGYSHVYDTDTHEIIKMGTWTTRAYSLYHPGKVDAYDEDSPWYDEMRQAHIDVLTKLWLLEQKHKYENDCREARKVNKGEYVVVVKGRKVPIGTEGVVFWMKESNYGYYDSGNFRIGIDTGDGNVEWTYSDNVVVLDPDMPDPADYIGEVEWRDKLAGYDLKKLHSTYCAYTSSLRYI